MIIDSSACFCIVRVLISRVAVLLVVIRLFSVISHGFIIFILAPCGPLVWERFCCIIGLFGEDLASFFIIFCHFWEFLACLC